MKRHISSIRRASVPLPGAVSIAAFAAVFALAGPATATDLVDSGLSYEDECDATAVLAPAGGTCGGSWRVAVPGGGTPVVSFASDNTPLWNLRLFSGGNSYGNGGVKSGTRMTGDADIPIDDATLDAWRETFAKARENGVLLTPRFAYDGDGVTGCEPSDFDMVLRHIAQISGVLNAFPDVVAAIECGIVGPFGEMWGSIYDDKVYAPRLIRAWLDSLDPRIKVLVRSPKYLFRLFKTEVLGNKDAALAPEQFLARRAELPDRDRLGLYNDGYLLTSSDTGTFPGGSENFTRDQAREFFSDLRAVPYGGEFGGYNSTGAAADAESYTNCPFASAYMVATNRYNQVRDWYDMHLSYMRGWTSGNRTIVRLGELPFSDDPFGFDGIDDGYATAEAFFRAMASGGMGFAFDGMPDLHEWNGRSLLDFMTAHMGPRFVLRASSLSGSAAPGGALDLRFEIENTGFGDLLRTADAEVLLSRDGVSFYAAPVAIDVAADVPSRAKKAFALSMELPSGIDEGDWNAYLRLHVPADVGEDNPSTHGLRTVRFANDASQWSEGLRANLLGTVRVSGAPSAAGLPLR
ncbi:MAG: DUF4832 domain-containing protein, partial [Kiritimatiellae bacterium]|nr:DUF4832 domain-containing protein [Kiritimatiellia bacterium]